MLSIDFDGVLHSYTSGWQGPTLIPDPPVLGAIDFLRAAVKRFEVVIFSSRSGQPGGIVAMFDWLNFHGLPREWITAHLKFPADKPAAWVTIDDRAMQFTGLFPSLDEIDSFRSWTQLVTPSAIPAGSPDYHRLPIEVSLCLASRTCLSLEQRLNALGVAASSLIVTAAKSKAEAGAMIDQFTMMVEDNMAAVLLRDDISKHLSSGR